MIVNHEGLGSLPAWIAKKEIKLPNADTINDVLKIVSEKVSQIASEFSDECEKLEALASEVGEKIIDTKDALKHELYRFSDTLSTIQDTVKDLFSSQDDEDGSGP